MKVALEIAEQEFDRMCRSRRIDLEEMAEAKDEADGFLTVKNRIVRVIQRGELVVDPETGDPIYTPPLPGAKPLRFHRPTGATFMAMDGVGGKDIGQMGRMVSVLADMTRTSKAEIAKLDGPDFQFCCSLASLFLVPR